MSNSSPHARALNAARFYAILDTGYVPRSRWRPTCAALIEGGAGLVQIRAKRETPAERAALLEEVLPLFADRTAAPILVINDDLELAARHPLVGLHIGQEDTPPEIARERLGPGRIIGLSTHAHAQAAAALALPPGVIDYFAVGPVFSTQTKPDYTPVGLTLVREVAAMRPRLPWFCIGGITRATIAEVVAAGARRVVIVSDVLTAADPAGAIRTALKSLPTG
ncbi:MAG: thiamine phosphate synthase [Opitutaceae bacterium]|nr:thiamine phosphate synthase [Opitutaceae bacterium]